MAKQPTSWTQRLTRLSIAIAVLVALALWALRGWGIDARSEPTAIEKTTALFLRGWMTPTRYKTLLNPVRSSPEVIAEGKAHFADHCASCHGNDGGGQTPMGRGLYPKAPDMRLARTQGLSDGEIFYIIENGVRLTGMPGWSTGTPEGETASWHLVHFIRHLPTLTPEELVEMESMNPRTPAELDEQKSIDDFLNGNSAPPAAPAPHKHQGQ
jgi:mono/diheme cytochrome c family protein